MTGALHHKQTTTDDNYKRAKPAESNWNRTRLSKAGDTPGFKLRGRVWLLWSDGGGKHSCFDQPDPTGHCVLDTGLPGCTTAPREKAARQQ